MGAKTRHIDDRGIAPSRQAILYARVSSKEQEKEGFSIPAQQKLLRGYAEANNLTVTREFIDVETARRSGRTGFGEMLAFLKRSLTCRVLLVEKTDRLYRNLKDWVTLDEIDLEIHLVKENVVLSRDSRSSEKFMHGIKVLMAKNYIDNLSEETRKGMLEKAEQGMWPALAPLGYHNVVAGPDGKRAIEPDPVMAPLVVRLFEWYATGKYSIEAVTQMALDAGLKFRRSKNLLPTATVHKILRNRAYSGHFDWKGKTYRGTYEPLITCELWDRVQAVLDGRHEKRHRKVKHDFAFSGLIACGHCGCALVGEIKKGRYVYYHCTGYKGKCPEPYTREEVLSGQFADVLKGLTFDEEILGWLKEALRESHGDEKRFHEEAIGRLRADYDRLQNRLDAMYADKLDGKVDEAFFDRKAAEWRSEQTRLLHSVQEHQSANQTYLDEGVQLLELASRAYELFIKQGFFRTFDEKAPILTGLGRHSRSCRAHNAGLQEGKSGSTIHLAFDRLQPIHVTLHRTITPGERDCRVHRRLVLPDALGEVTNLRARAGLGPRQPILQRAARLLADQALELVRQVQGGRQIGACRPDLVQAGLGLDRPLLGATDPVEGELPRRGRPDRLGLGRVHSRTRLAGPSQAIGQRAADRGVGQPNALRREFAMQLGGVDLSLGDAGVDPLAMFVHPGASSPPRPPFGAFLVTEVATHRSPRHGKISGDLPDRCLLAMKLMDLLEPLDPTTPFGKSGLLSR